MRWSGYLGLGSLGRSVVPCPCRRRSLCSGLRIGYVACATWVVELRGLIGFVSGGSGWSGWSGESVVGMCVLTMKGGCWIF